MTAEEKQSLIVQIRQYLQAVDNNSTMFTHVSVFHDMARVALTALITDQAELAPEGWKLVPVEPTEEMIAAGDQFMDGLSRLGDAYDAMLAAAPEVE